MFSEALSARAAAFVEVAGRRGERVVSAESCTGGALAALLTAGSGASAVFLEGVVVYGNVSKMVRLGVSPRTLEVHGAVSAEVAVEMCAGGLGFCGGATLSVAITGVAGPGSSEFKPCGLVYVGWQRRGGDAEVGRFNFGGDRGEVRLQAVTVALEGLWARVVATSTISGF